jgi:uncharacterized protein YjdB
MSNSFSSLARRALLPLAALLLILWACSQVTTDESYLSLSKLTDSLKTYDSVRVLVKDRDGNILDTAFHGPVVSRSDLVSLPVPHYKGDKAVISIIGYRNDLVVYESMRYYDGAKGKSDSILPVILPTATIGIAANDTQVTQGDSVPLPMVTVAPPELLDKAVEWYTLDTQFVSIGTGRYLAKKTGTAHLRVRIKSDPSKQAGFTVEVAARAGGKYPDSLRLLPDTLRLSVDGAEGRFTLKVYPPSASGSVAWTSLDTSIAYVTQSGVIRGVKEGKAGIRIVSKEDADKADTAWVLVSGEVGVDSIAFPRDSLDLFVGGVRESLVVKAYPASANQGVDLSVKDASILELDQGRLKGLMEGATYVVARSRKDASRTDTLYVKVSGAEHVDSVRVLSDTVPLFVGGADSALQAKAYPTASRQDFFWYSSDPEIAAVDASGKVSTAASGKVFITAVSRADSSRKDSALIIVKKDTPRLSVGSDTTIAVGATLAFSPKVSQEYGVITRFKWDLDGDGTWDDSAASVEDLKAPLSHRYDKEQDVKAAFYVRDGEGNDTLVYKKVKAVKGPVILILSPADNSDTNQVVIDVSWSVDGAPQTTFIKQTLVNGPNTITRKALDGNGKEFSASITVYLDTVPPAKPLLHAPVAANTQIPTWTWAGGGGGNGTFRYRLDNQDMTGATLIQDTSFTPATKLTEELHTLFVQEQDGAGNWSATSRLSIVIDLAPPGIPKVTVTQGSLSNEPKPTWTWISGGDGMGTYRYRLDSSDLSRNATQGTAATYKPGDSLSGGDHTLYVQERDSAGNWSETGSAKVTLDFIAPNSPVWTVKPDSVTASGKPTWTWSSGGGGGSGAYRYKLDSGEYVTGSPFQIIVSFIPGTNLSNGVHTLYVQERDLAGNWSASSAAATRVNVAPLAAPVFSAAPLSPLNSLKPTWTWTSASGNGTGTYRCKIDDTVWASADSVKAPAGNAQYTPSVPLSEALHTLFVEERDASGIWSPVASKSILVALRGVVGGGPFGKGGAGRTSLAFDASGVLYMAVADQGDSDRVKVVRLSASGTAWENVGGSKVASLPGNFPSLVFSPGGIPYVAFSNYQTGSKAVVMRLNAGGTAWELVGNSDFSTGSATFPSLAFTAAGVPYVAFSNATLAGKATIMRLNGAGTGWENVGGASATTGEASSITLRINKAGTIYLSFTDVADNFRARVMRLNAGGTAWENVGGAAFSPTSASSPSMALDSSGLPNVAFGDNSGAVSVMRLNAGGAAWELLGPANLSAGQANLASIAFNGADVPYVAFSSVVNSNKAQVVRLNAAGTAWETVGPAGLSSGASIYPIVAVSPAGVPYVSFDDGTASNTAVVMKVSFDP